jgi:hypothetical protein
MKQPSRTSTIRSSMNSCGSIPWEMRRAPGSDSSANDLRNAQ